ncbi:MAG: VRR-NUC domain-containing protein [Clostridia bacterium]|nr:VRR-NUC domain-containing protein [Clostridia bacterium]
MREKDVERKLVRLVRDAGGLALKFVSPGMAGVPDRLLLFPGGRVAFCEVKAPGEKPRPLQLHRMEQLRRLGFRVYVVDGEEQIGAMICEIQAS